MAEAGPKLAEEVVTIYSQKMTSPPSSSLCPIDQFPFVPAAGLF